MRRAWPLILAALLLSFVFLKVAEPVRVSSSSMSPTLHSGDHVLVEKFGHRAHSPRRGDIVALHGPGSAGLLIKRVVAIAGDTVGIEDGVLVVNAVQVKESFVDYSQMDSVYFGPVTVPAATVFTMGDNRSNSIDSRSFGPVRTADLIGRVVFRLRF